MAIRTNNENHDVFICKNDVTFFLVARQYGDYWFTITTSCKTIKGAIKSCIRQMSAVGYDLNMDDVNKAMAKYGK